MEPLIQPYSMFNTALFEHREKLARELWKAVVEDDINRVKDLLDQGADVNHQLYWTKEWEWKNPPIHKACERGNLEIVKTLQNSGAEIEKGDGLSGRTPLHDACRGGHRQLVDYLIKEAKCNVGKLFLVCLFFTYNNDITPKPSLQ